MALNDEKQVKAEMANAIKKESHGYKKVTNGFMKDCDINDFSNYKAMLIDKFSMKKATNQNEINIPINCKRATCNAIHAQTFKGALSQFGSNSLHENSIMKSSIMPPIYDNSRHLRFDSLPGSQDQTSVVDSIYETRPHHKHGHNSLDNTMNLTKEIRNIRDILNSRSVDR